MIEEVPKKHKLLELFNKKGISHPIDYVLDYTGMETEASLRTVMWQFRIKRIADIRMKFGFIIRRDF